jgi:hypothetical protein
MNSTGNFPHTRHDQRTHSEDLQLPPDAAELAQLPLTQQLQFATHPQPDHAESQ